MPSPRDVLRNNGLSLVWFGLFLVFLVGQTLTGYRVHNQDAVQHGNEPEPLGSYLTSGHFGEAVFENWESEFLQMMLFVVLTAVLFQKGAAESKDPEKDEEPVDEDPRKHRGQRDVPGPVRKGGLALKLYENSLSLVLGTLFLGSMALHAITGLDEYNSELQDHGQQAASLFGYVGSSQFWFESFQNWQSEFLAVGALTVQSIWLRQRGSPESKPVHASHAKTGAD